MVKEDTKSGEYQIVKQGKEDVIRISMAGIGYPPSLEGSALCMMQTISKLSQVPGVSRIIFTDGRNYEYGYEQTQMLVEIAGIYNHLIKQKNTLTFGLVEGDASRRTTIQNLILNLLRSDPVGCYVEIKRILREEKVMSRGLTNETEIRITQMYISLLNYIFTLLDKTKLIERVRHRLDGYIVGDREIYSYIFRSVITPDFMYTRLTSRIPLNGELLDTYKIDRDTDVNIFRIPGDVKYLYHLNPPEFKFDEDRLELIHLARTVLAEHKPREEEFIDPERMRVTFFNIGRDMLQELADRKGLRLNYSDLKQLTNVLVRYTVGFGLIETLLGDQKVQDITLNGPMGQTPVFLVHETYDECVTNITPSREDALSWATKFRILSGRPLDEANPILDTELSIPEARARVAIISTPLSPWGLAYSIRRHRDKPWTLPLFVNNKMITPMAAGLMSFLIDGARTMLIAGTRSSGKTSLLGASLVEIMRKYRIITTEDTLELPTDALRNLGYNIQPMKVRSALGRGGTEVAADEGIRAALRMGDSALIVGEIRSTEASALYEAMRVGALANVVAGTIHGDSPYGVFDRVVNDLKVPRTSFKATDIIVVANPVRSADGLHKWRRVTQITEVRKTWEEDPLREQGFVDLMKYDSKEDRLKPTDELLNGNSEIIKNIAANVKEWAGDWDAVWDNIILRAKIKEALVNYSKVFKKPEMLEAEFVIQANDMFHIVSENIKEREGTLNSEMIYREWEDWLKKRLNG